MVQKPKQAVFGLIINVCIPQAVSFGEGECVLGERKRGWQRVE